MCQNHCTILYSKKNRVIQEHDRLFLKGHCDVNYHCYGGFVSETDIGHCIYCYGGIFTRYCACLLWGHCDYQGYEDTVAFYYGDLVKVTAKGHFGFYCY